MKQKYENIPIDVILYLLEKNLSKPAMRLYLLLRAYRNNGNGTAWVGRAKIIKQAHIHKDDVARARAELEAVGLIAIEHRSGRTPIVSFNDYVVPSVGTSVYDPSRIRGLVTPPEKGDYTSPEKGDTTTTNTTTNKTNSVVVTENETTTKGSRVAPAEIRNMKKAGTGQVDSAGLIKKAVRDHFQLTPKWSDKWNQEWLQWAIEEQVTPEQIEIAAETWSREGRFNWRSPSLSSIQTSWLALTKQQKYTGMVEGV